MPNDNFYIKRCIELALKGTGKVSPNPRVGAVVVSGGEIIGEGYHKYFGGPHAEVSSLQGLTKDDVQEATLYVNLEPCCFEGKTPACSDLIMNLGILRVVVGMADPNPRVNGCGVDCLRKAGITVKTGVWEKQCRELNRGYIKYITTGMPEVILKTANTLDGRIGTASGDSRWITGKTARTYTHALRAEFDAIMVGVRTVLADNPMLNVRHVEGKNPLRVIVDSRLRTPFDFNVVQDQDKLPTVIFVAENISHDKCAPYQQLGCQVIKMPLLDNGYLSLPDILKHLGDMGVCTLMVEGGATVFSSFLAQGLADRLISVVAPKVIGADGIPVIGNFGISLMGEVESWKFRRVKKLGEDVMLDIILKDY